MRQCEAAGTAPFWKAGCPPGVEASKVVIIPYIKNDVFCGSCFLYLDCPKVCLINAVTADSVVLYRFLKVRGIFDYKPDNEDSVKPFLGPSRLDMLNRIGYVVTESSYHFPEYVPYYLQTEELREKYKIPVDKYRDNIDKKGKEYQKLVQKAREGSLPPRERSPEYG